MSKKPKSQVADDAAPQQYLTFTVGAEEYGVDLLQVQEIRAFSTLTPLPGTPPHVRGIINLRGAVVPVIGLRERFGMPSVAFDRYTVIVVLQAHERVVGVIVDAVSDVLSLPPQDVGASPLAGLGDKVVKALGKAGGRLVTLLDGEVLVSEVLEEPTAEAA